MSDSTILRPGQRDQKTHLADSVPTALLEDHDLEPLEVARGLPLLNGSALLGPGGLLPLGGNVRSLELLLDGRRSGGAGKLGEEVRGEDEVLERGRLAGDRVGGVVDQGLVGGR